MNYFNWLPLETIEFIFKKLNFDDLINLRIVDKRFKQICQQFKIKQLIVSDYSDYYHSYHSPYWFHTNNPIYFQVSLIEPSKFHNYATIFQLDLKRLVLHITDDFNFSILNEFILLEQLDVSLREFHDNYKLSLNNLKIVDFCLDYKSDFKLTFDTIKLFAFRFVYDEYSEDDFVFKYPDKILFFEIEFDQNWPLLYDNYLKNFNNLQYLKLNGLHSDSIDRNILTQFKNLEILNLSCHLLEEYDNVIEDIKFIINEKEKLKRSEFEFYFNGVKLINQNIINQIKLSELLEFQIKNYDLLKDNCDKKKINYCDLIKLIKIIPSSFKNKFPFIHEVSANDHIDNEDQFIEFLNNLPYLNELSLINCELTKSFYDKLINLVYLNDLKYLIIKEKNDLEINFDFILNTKKLEFFSTNQFITNHIDLIYKLFKENAIYLFKFKFDSKNYIQIYRYNSELEIRSFYLDDNLKEVDNFSIDKLKDLDCVISKLKELKF